MRHIARATLPLALAAVIAGGANATAREPLGQNGYVTERLVAARVADRIRKTCPSIGGRIIYAFRQAYALKNWAVGQGYSSAEIEAFLDDKAEKKVIYARAEDYLVANGATPGNVEGFCTLGRNEIAAKSITGSLLYEK